jgi:energy-coupling factor transporter ATP-binding protein EcfA2
MALNVTVVPPRLQPTLDCYRVDVPPCDFLKQLQNRGFKHTSRHTQYKLTFPDGVLTHTFVPSDDEFEAEHNNYVFKVVCERQGLPVAVGSSQPVYYKKVYVEHACCEALHAFVKEVMQVEPVKDIRTVRVYINGKDGVWQAVGTCGTPSLDHVFLPEAQVKDVVARLVNFYAAKERYLAFGRPYQLTILLQGPPGCGKSTLVKALAGVYKREIFTLNFNADLTDEKLITALSNVPENSFVVAEDADALFHQRETTGSKVSFSTFINCLDGPLTNSVGRIVFLSVNDVTKLDPALLRPGRIDARYVFDGKCDKACVRKAFLAVTAKGDDAFATWWASFKQKLGGVSMAGLVDLFFNHSDDYEAATEETIKQARELNAHGREAAQHISV